MGRLFLNGNETQPCIRAAPQRAQDETQQHASSRAGFGLTPPPVPMQESAESLRREENATSANAGAAFLQKRREV